MDGFAGRKDAAHFHGAVRLLVAFCQQRQRRLAFADADLGRLHGLFQQRFLHGLGKLVQFVRPVHAVHIPDQRHVMAAHFHQGIVVGQGHQFAQDAVSAGLVGVLHLEQHHRAPHLQGYLVFARTGRKLSAQDFLPQRPPVYVAVAGDGQAAAEHGRC